MLKKLLKTQMEMLLLQLQMGTKKIITPEQVVKTAATANDPKAGNDIVKPADKVVVNESS